MSGGRFWAACGIGTACVADVRAVGRPGRRDDARRAVVSGRAVVSRTSSAGKRGRWAGGAFPPRLTPAETWTWAHFERRPHGSGRIAPDRGRSRRPRRGLHAKRRRRPRPLSWHAPHRRVWSCCSPDFGVANDRRPVRPDRAERPPGGGRLPLRGRGYDRAGLVEEPGAALPSLRHDGAAALPRTGYGREGDSTGSSSRRATSPHLRAGALRPSPLDRLLLRHHRAAEGDRPGSRRDRDRAPEELRLQHDLLPGTAHVVHHNRMDDVELS